MKKGLLLPLVLVLALFLAGAAQGKTVVVRVQAPDYQTLYNHVTFKGTSIDIAGVQPGKTYDLVLDESDLPVIRSCGLSYETVVPDLEYWQNLSGLDGSYQSYTDLVTSIRTLASLYSNICVMESIGPTYEGRWIYGVKISDNPQSEEPGEQEVLLYGQIHAREWAAGQVLRHTVDTLLRNYTSNAAFRDWIDGHQLWIFPVFNVDGFTYDYPGQVWWRKNRQPFGGAIGTDMNRNGNGASDGRPEGEWGALVSGSRTSNNPDDETFDGSRGFSAPETKALTDLFRQHTFVLDISIHSYSELVLWPWGQNATPPDGAFMTSLGQGAAALIGSLGGGHYTPQQSIYLYPTNSGIEDWFYGWAHTVGGFPCPAYTFEVGTTFYQPTSDLNSIQTQNFEGIWYGINRADTIAAQLRGMVAPPAIARIDTSSFGDYVVHWTPLRPAYNTPDKWELEELQDLSVVTDNIDAGTGNWTLNGATSSTTQKHSGTNSLFLGNASNIDYWARTKDPYKVISANDSVTFWVWHNLENNYDVGICEVSLEGKEWFLLHDRYTGNSSGWVRKAYSLAPWLGKSVFIRFREATDDGTNSGGMYVDDVYPVPIYGTRNVISNNITDTLYAFTGKPDGHYYYRVRGHNTAWNWGDQSCISDVQVGASGIAQPPAPARKSYVTRLGIAPNPFVGQAGINYSLSRGGRASISIFDASGRLVRNLVSANQQPGEYQSRWDGKDGFGRKVAPGVYVCRLEADKVLTTDILMLQ